MNGLHFDVWDADDPTGTALGELTEAYEKHYQGTHQAIPAGDFTINIHSPQAAWAKVDNFVRVRRAPGGPFPYNDSRYIGAFWLETGTRTLLSEDEEGGEELTIGGRGPEAALRWAILYPDEFDQRNKPFTKDTRKDGNWHIPNVTAGEVLTIFLRDLDDRTPNPLPYITRDFNIHTDSDGDAWSDTGTDWAIPVGTNGLDLLATCVSGGLYYRVTPAFRWHAYEDEPGVDRSGTITLAEAHELAEAADQDIAARTTVSRVVVQGTKEKGGLKFREVVNATVEASLPGRREGFVEYRRSPTNAKLDQAGTRYIRKAKQHHDGPLQFRYVETAGKEAFTNFVPGDIVRVNIPGPFNNTSLRVYAISLDEDEAGNVTPVVDFEQAPFDPNSGDAAFDKNDGANCGDCPPLPPYIPTPIAVLGDPAAAAVALQRPGNRTGTINPLLVFDGTGDATVPGHFHAWAKSGAFEYVIEYIDGANRWTGFRTTGVGTITVHFEGSMATVIDVGTSTCTFSITKNGVVVGQDIQSNTVGGLTYWAPSSIFNTGPIPVVDGDVFKATCSVAGFPRMEQIVSAGVGTNTDGLWVPAATLAPVTYITPPPLEGQFGTEQMTGDGVTTLFQTNYPYALGSLEVHVDGMLTPVTATDPLAGQFTFATAPVLNAVIIVNYQNAGTVGTGATHPYPTASTPPRRAITISDEGTPVTTQATGVNFVGAGVTAIAAGDVVTVTIPGGMVNPMTAPGDMVYGGGTPTNKALSSLGATASSTGSWGGVNPAANLIDGSDATVAVQGNDANAQITIDLGAIFTISSVRLKGDGGSYGTPNTQRINYSANGTTWTLLETITNASRVADLVWTLTTPTSARYWKIDTASGVTNEWRLYTVELRGAAPSDMGAPLRFPGTTAYGRSLLTSADAAAARTAIGVPTTLDGLTDVDTTASAPTNGQALVYESSSSLWKPGTVSGGGGGGGGTPTTTIGVAAYHSTTQAVAAGATDTVLFDSEDFDTDAFHSTSTNTGRITIPAGLGGKYLVTYHVHATSLPATNPQLDFTVRKNGTGNGLRGSEAGQSFGTAEDIPGGEWVGHAIADLAAGDYLEIRCFSTDAITIGHANSGIANTFSIIKLDSGKVGTGVGCRVVRTTDQGPITSGAATAVIFNAADIFDTDGFHDPAGANPSRITIPAGLGGKYLVSYSLIWQTTSGTYRSAVIRKNGTTPAGGFQRIGTAGTPAFIANATADVLDLVAGDYIEIVGQEDATEPMVGSVVPLWASLMRLDSGSTGASTLDALSDVDTSTVAPTNGQALVYDLASSLWKPGSVASGGGASSAFVGCSVGGAGQSVPATTFTAINFPSETWDTDAFHSTSTNTSRLTVPAGLSGKYLITAALGLIGSSAEMILIISKNGAGSSGSWLSRTVSGTSDAEHSGSIVLDLVAGDYIEMYCYLGGARTLSSYTRMEMVKLDSGRAGNGIGAKALNTAATSVASGVVTAIPYAAADIFDTDGFHNPAVNNTRHTVPAGLAGKYLIHAQITWNGALGHKDSYAVIKKNGTTDIGFIRPMVVSSGVAEAWNISAIDDLLAGDYIEVQVYQPSGSAKALEGTSGYNTFSIMRLDSGGAGSIPTTLDALTDVDTSTTPPTNGQALVYDTAATLWKPGSVASGGGGVSTAFIGASAYKSTDQLNLTPATFAKITFDTAEWNTDGLFDNANDRMTIPAGLGGKWLVSGMVAYTGATAASTDAICAVYKNGTAFHYFGRGDLATNEDRMNPVSVIVDLVPGDYIEMWASPGSASVVDIRGGVTMTKLQVTKLESGKAGTGIGARASTATAQSIASGTWTNINLVATDTFDTDGFHDPAVNASRVTIPAGLGGKYLCVVSASHNQTNAGSRYVGIGKNGGASPVSAISKSADQLVHHVLEHIDVLDLVAGDYVSVMAYQDSGGANNVLGATMNLMRLDSGGSGSVPRSNYTAVVNPAVTDDSAAGYAAGSQWLNTALRILYVCKVATAGAAVWHPISANVVLLSVGASATVYIPDADIPRNGQAFFTDGANSGAGIMQWYRHGSFNSMNGVGTSNHNMQFQNTTYSGGGTGFSWFIESNSAGARIGCKNNNGFGRDFVLTLY